jgi:hypothetical protein
MEGEDAEATWFKMDNTNLDEIKIPHRVTIPDHRMRDVSQRIYRSLAFPREWACGSIRYTIARYSPPRTGRGRDETR